jgi:hypothetical protein
MRKWPMWTCTLRVIDVYRQEKSLFFSFQFDLTVDWKIYNEYLEGEREGEDVRGFHPRRHAQK